MAGVSAADVSCVGGSGVGGFGVALLGLSSYFVGGFEGSNVEGPLLDRVEAYSALVGVLVVLGALLWQTRGR